MDDLIKTLQKPAPESKKFAFARFATVILALLSTIALAAVVAAILLGADRHVVWLGIVAATGAGGIALLAFGYVLGQSALDMILTKAIGIITEAKHFRQ